MRDITRQIADDAEAGVSHTVVDEDPAVNLSPHVIPEVRAHANGGRVLLLDGSTITAEDTPENQESILRSPFRKQNSAFPSYGA